MIGLIDVHRFNMIVIVEWHMNALGRRIRYHSVRSHAMTRPLAHFPSQKAPKRSFLWGTTQTHTGCSSVQSSSFMQLMSSGAVVCGFCADVDEGMDGNTGFRTGEELGVRNCMVIHVLSGIGV